MSPTSLPPHPAIPTPAYPRARAAAARALAVVARHRDAGVGLAGGPAAATDADTAREDALAPLPDVATLEAALDVAFWASLRREEGHTPRVSLAFLPPEAAGEPLTFAAPIPVTAVALTRLAPAVDRPGIHLGVAVQPDGTLALWGTTRRIPRYCLVLEVVAPGLLVLKHRRGERRDGDGGKFVNVAVLEGDVVKLVDQAGECLRDGPPMVTSLVGLTGQGMAPGDPAGVLVQLAVSMRAHGRGGALLVVPPGGDWRRSIVRSLPYAVEPPHAAIPALLTQRPAEGRGQEARAWRGALQRAVDGLAGLTAVDGATIIDTAFALRAFGAKIARRRGQPLVERVLATEPIEGSAPVAIGPSQLGGTRHLSAAQFVHDQRDALALVASQDGRFTVFAWSPRDEMVRAHRIETLLL